MKNFESLLAAYLIAWAIFFGYHILVGRRVTHLCDEVERLKARLAGK